MNVPPQFTASGVGEAIPVSSLGDIDLTATAYNFVGTSTKETITIETTVVSATTVNGIVIPATTMNGTTIVGSGIETASLKKGEASVSGASSALFICLISTLALFGSFMVME
jgi:hypothetical protein